MFEGYTVHWITVSGWLAALIFAIFIWRSKTKKEARALTRKEHKFHARQLNIANRLVNAFRDDVYELNRSLGGHPKRIRVDKIELQHGPRSYSIFVGLENSTSRTSVGDLYRGRPILEITLHLFAEDSKKHIGIGWGPDPDKGYGTFVYMSVDEFQSDDNGEKALQRIRSQLKEEMGKVAA